ncbi:hypothetical protein, partial [Nocardia abscessus]|uniref:hypothetical protein n=1 Tax=Nocardia abscessus TaxID=120957 RepID=UPI002456C206
RVAWGGGGGGAAGGPPRLAAGAGPWRGARPRPGAPARPPGAGARNTVVATAVNAVAVSAA